MASEKKFILTILSVIILNFIFALVLWRVIDVTGGKKDEVLKVKEELVFYEKRLGNVKQIEFAFAGKKSEWQRIELIFLDKNSLVKFIEELESLSKTSNLELKVNGVTVLDGSPTEVIFDFNLAGSFSDIYKSVLLLENNKYQVVFKRFSLQKDFEESVWTANVGLRFLNYKR